MSNVYGVTGLMGAGKSSVARMLGSQIKDSNIIEIDDIRRELLWGVSANQNLQEEISNQFGLSVKNFESQRTKLSDRVFDNKENLKKYANTLFPYIAAEIEKQMNLFTHTLLVWAYLAEDGYLNYVNQTVFLVHTHNDIIKSRNKFDVDTEKRILVQSSFEEKRELIKCCNKRIIEIDNNQALSQIVLKKEWF